jgi:putative xylitol transport system permease protein
VPVIIFVVVAVIGYLVLNYTTYGRSIYATGGNPVSAWLAGINVKHILFSVFMISGFATGLAGLVQTARSMSAAMTNLIGLELDAIASVVMGGVSLFGGRGTLIGVVIGVFIIGIINNGMNLLMISPAFQSIVKGAIIVAAVGIDCLRRR